MVWQSLVTGPILSLAHGLQKSAIRRAGAVDLAGSIFIVGYWRSGTTLLHELLCNDQRYAFPTTYACMNPQHFVLTEGSAKAANTRAVKRPMDDLVVRATSPQEDEFALLGLGARSAYEALLTPSHFGDALRLSDPHELTPAELLAWKSAFLEFLSGVALVGGRKALIVKSPTHGHRIAVIRELIPDARFIHITRDPYIVFESAVGMWCEMMTLYGLDPIPDETAIRHALLDDRVRFEENLAHGRSGLPPEQFVDLRYEDLVGDPLSVLEFAYMHLGLDFAADVRRALMDDVSKRHDYRAKNTRPDPYWTAEIARRLPLVAAAYKVTAGKASAT